MLQGSYFLLFVHLSLAKSRLWELFYHIEGVQKIWRRARNGVPYVVARSEIPRLRFGTGSAISSLVSLRGDEGDEAISVGVWDCHAPFRCSQRQKGKACNDKKRRVCTEKKRGRGQAPPRQIHAEEKNIVDPFFRLPFPVWWQRPDRHQCRRWPGRISLFRR